MNNTKIKIFYKETSTSLGRMECQDEINSFMSDKNVLDVKIDASSSYGTYYVVIYTD